MGLKPTEVYELELWEFNRYIIGYRSQLKRDEANIIKTAYNTAAFTNSKRKPKPLSYYLGKIFSNSNDLSDQERKKRVEWAKEIDKKINKIKSETIYKNETEREVETHE